MMYTTQQVLDLITSTDNFAEELRARNPRIDADITSFKLNPNCSCKNKVIRDLDENPLELEFAKEWEYLHSVTPEVTPEVVDENAIRLKKEKHRMVLKPSLPQSEWKNFKDVIGETVEIEPNPDKYKELMVVAREKWFYNGLHVIETMKTNTSDESQKIVWVVFFY